MKVNAKLIAEEGGTDTPVVKMTFEIPRDELSGLKFSRWEFVLDIVPVEDLVEYSITQKK